MSYAQSAKRKMHVSQDKQRLFPELRIGGLVAVKHANRQEGDIWAHHNQTI